MQCRYAKENYFSYQISPKVHLNSVYILLVMTNVSCNRESLGQSWINCPLISLNRDWLKSWWRSLSRFCHHFHSTVQIIHCLFFVKQHKILKNVHEFHTMRRCQSHKHKVSNVLGAANTYCLLSSPCTLQTLMLMYFWCLLLCYIFREELIE